MTQAVILCGGLGTRLREETEFRPKPMVAIGGRPILWHIMSHYRAHGVRDFILCLGYKGDVIRDYFLNFRNYGADLRVDLSDGAVETLGSEKTDWRVTMIDTGANAMTGARIKRIAKYIEGDQFFVTYGDGVSNVDIGTLMEFHRSEGRKATVTAVRPPSRFGELSIEDRTVRSFVEKPQTGAGWINGGFCVFNTEVAHSLPDDESLSLEADVLESLAAKQQLSVFKHADFWQCMDTFREMQILNDMWASGTAPWKTWKLT